MDDITELRSDVSNLRQRTTVLIWAVGVVAGLTIAILGNLITQSYQLGQTIGRLDVLISHVQMH
jgi:hypothetical protein